MRRRPPRSTRTDTLFPYTTLFRSGNNTMIHALTPDLGDPLLLAEATLPALQEVLEFDRGEAKLTYDPTLKNPIRIRPASGTTFDTEGARNRLADMIETLSTAGAPFQDRQSTRLNSRH